MLCYIERFCVKIGRKKRERKDREGKEGGKEGGRQESYLLDNKNLEGIARYHGASLSVIQMQKLIINKA